MHELVVSGLLAGGHAPQPAPPAEDWIARGLAAASLIVSIVVAVIGYRGKIWRGRRDSLPSLTEPLEELRSAIDAVHQDGTNLYQFWATRKSVALGTLREITRDFPDARMQRLVRQFRAQVALLRGDQPIVVAAGQDPPTMTAAQRKALTQASATLAKIDSRISTVRRKGSTG